MNDINLAQFFAGLTILFFAFAALCVIAAIFELKGRRGR